MDKQAVLIWTAIHELKLDVPVYRSEIDVGADGVSPKVTLHLYGGQVVTWQPSATTVAPPLPRSPLPSGEGQGEGPKPKPKVKSK